MYVMSYFKTDAEALHLAVSGDGLHWQAVRGGAAIFRSALGAKSVRDPFLCAGGDGLFHLLFTTAPSPDSIGHAVSDDLLSWRQEAHVPVMASVPGVQNCWAPEAFWDSDAQQWRVIWSSSTMAPNTPSDGNHRIWGCATRDWRAWTPPALFFDPGYSVIDATVVALAPGRYLMAFKDERGHNPPRHEAPGQRKAIGFAFAPGASGPWTEVSDLVTPPLTEGPALFRRGGQWVMLFDHFMEERFGALASADGLHWEPLMPGIEFLPGLRHASVLSVSDAIGRGLPL